MFLDTEFSDFLRNPTLISLGLVSDDGQREFYVELNTFDPLECSDFCKACVLPLLDRTPETTVDNDGLRQRLLAFLQQFQCEPDVVVSYDYIYDWQFFQAAAGGQLPSNIRGENVYPKVSRESIDEWFALSPNRLRHHSLHDARALRAAFEHDNGGAEC